MTSDLTISSAVWECRVDGVPLVAGIAEAERYVRFSDLGGRGYSVTFDEPGPPADLVALRDARCETCWTLSVVMENPDDLHYSDELGAFTVDGDIRTKPCPDCVDGRPLVNVRVPCDGSMDTCPDRPGTPDFDPTRCDGHRTVNGLVDVVPVVSSRTSPELCPKSNYVEVTETQGSVSLVVYSAFGDHEDEAVGGEWDWRGITPAHGEALGTIQPGMWAWLFTEVEA